MFVAPYVGAWIETYTPMALALVPSSHPTWVRGLKRKVLIGLGYNPSVAPYVGAWIETFIFLF